MVKRNDGCTTFRISDNGTVCERGVVVCIQRQVTGYTLYDHKTNDYIRHELRITGILDKIDEYRRNWLPHLRRIPQNRIPLKPYNYTPQGRRTIGRPKKRWREQL